MSSRRVADDLGYARPVDSSDPLVVAVWSDYTCPFCWVATERIERLRVEHGAEVSWYPFDLHPEYPDEGISREELIARLGPGVVDVPRRLSEESGLPYAPHPERIPRSRKALELTEWARTVDEERMRDLHERVMRAYWAEAQDISDVAVLADRAEAAGLDRAEAIEAIAGGGFAEAVDASTAYAQRAGIDAVPAFVLDRRLLLLGAVDHAQLDAAVAQARSRSE
jgi:predicted DsbA family dithiol-disulfide isomerase